jgi:hypothetical protein
MFGIPETVVNLEATVNEVVRDAKRFASAYALYLTLILLFVALFFVIYLSIRLRHAQQIHDRELNHRYRRLHYGDDIESATRTYISLIKFHSSRIFKTGRAPGDVKDTKVVLIGVNEEEECRIWHEASRDASLDKLLFGDRPFAFPSMKHAMYAVDKYCQCLPHYGNSTAIDFYRQVRPKTLFVFLLISSNDPTVNGPHDHLSHVAGSLEAGAHYVSIIGTGSHNGQRAHKCTFPLYDTSAMDIRLGDSLFDPFDTK